MSDDTLDISFGEVDFSQVKEFPQPAEGTYEFVVDDYKVTDPQKAESKGKGKNIQLVLKFADPYDVRTDLGEEADFTGFKTYINMWLHYENPFGVVAFFRAVGGHDNNDFKLSMSDIMEPSNYIGEQVGAVLNREPHYKDPKKTQMKVDTDSFYAV